MSGIVAGIDVIVDVTKAEAVLRGELRHGEITVNIPSWEGWTDEERAVLADKLGKYGNAAHLEHVQPTVEAVHAWVTARLVERRKDAEREAQEKAERTAAILANPRAHTEEKHPGGGMTCLYCHKSVLPLRRRWSEFHVRGIDTSRPEFAGALARLNVEEEAQDQARFDAHVKECQAQAEREAQKKIMEEAKKAAEIKRADAWEAAKILLIDGGMALSEEQTTRFGAGFLPEQEIQAAIEAMLFAGVCLESYEKLRRSDLGNDPDGYCAHDEVKFTARGECELTAEQFAELIRVKGMFPERRGDGALAVRYDVEPRWHRARCSCGAPDVYRWSLRVTATFITSGKTFSREYALLNGAFPSTESDDE